MGDDLVEEVHQLRAAIADHRRALDDLEARLRRLDERERAADGRWMR